MAWNTGDKSADALIRSSGGSLADDELYEDGPFSPGYSANAHATFALSGKLYIEAVLLSDTTSGRTRFGFSNSTYDVTDQEKEPGEDANSWVIEGRIGDANFQKFNNNSGSTISSGEGSPAVNDVLQICIDTATGKVWFGINDAYDGDPGADTGEAYTITGSGFKVVGGTQDAWTGVLRIQSTTASQSFSPPSGVTHTFVAPETDPPLTVPVGSLTLTGQVPVAAVLDPVFPAVGALSLTGHVPTLEFGTPGLISVPVGALAIGGAIPTAVVTRLTSPPTRTLALNGQVPTVSVAPASTSLPAVGALTLTGHVPVMLPVQGVLEIDLSSVLSTAFVGGQSTDATFDVDLPGLIGEWTWLNGDEWAINAAVPALENDLFPGYVGDTELPALEAEFIADTGLTFVLDTTLPSLQAEFAGFVEGEFAFDVSLPALQVEWTALTGRTFIVEAELPALEAQFTADQVGSFALDAALPALQATWTALTGIIASLEAEFAPLEANWLSDEDFTALLYEGWGLNTINFAHGPYDSVAFDGLGRLGNNTYAAMSDGLYRLDGEDDAGTSIQAYYLLGFEDFGIEAVKGQRVAYIGYSTDGEMELLVRADTKQNDVLAYPVEARHEADGDTPARVKLGRGLRGRHWQYGMRNIDGSDFQVKRMGLGIWPGRRKT